MSASYNYTADGVRTSKTVDGVTHTYYYVDGKLLREVFGTTVLDFFYDGNGTPIAMRQGSTTSSNYTNYYYITNLQGDVIRLVDIYGNTAALYSYDPFGNTISATGSHASINPLRYRGYYYDTETGLYYLQSRYYDPAIGRFINCDEFASTGQSVLGHNMFAYCGNNPVVYYDPNGRRHIMHADACGSFNPETASNPQNIFEAILINATSEPENGITFSVSLSGSATCYGLGAGEQASISVDSTHSYALQTSTSAVASYGKGVSFGLGLNFTVTNAKYVTDLDGKSLAVGGTMAGPIGLAIDYIRFIPASDPNVFNHGISVTLLAGAGISGEISQAETVTHDVWNPLKALREALFGSGS